MHGVLRRDHHEGRRDADAGEQVEEQRGEDHDGRSAAPAVMPALVADIHDFLGSAGKAWMAPQLGHARVAQYEVPQSGKPDCGDKPGHGGG